MAPFNGAVLAAKKGKIIYRNNTFGKANFQAGTNFTPETPSNIGSVTIEVGQPAGTAESSWAMTS
jgi:hypothetical protein